MRYTFKIHDVQEKRLNRFQASEEDVYLMFYFTTCGKHGESFFSVKKSEATDENIKKAFQHRVDIEMHNLKVQAENKIVIRREETQRQKQERLIKKRWINKAITKKL